MAVAHPINQQVCMYVCVSLDRTVFRYMLHIEDDDDVAICALEVAGFPPWMATRQLM